MIFLHNKNYLEEINKFFSNNFEIDIAVAFFGQDVIKLFDKYKNINIKIICNLESGACNPYLIEKLNKYSNIKIKTNKYLHSKILISDNQVIIGSANLSANGLSFEGKELDGWIEAGLLSDDNSLIINTKDWFREVWKNSSKITESIIKAQKIKWKRKRNRRDFINIKKSIIESFINNKENFKDRSIFIACYREEPSKEAMHAFDNIIAEQPHLPGNIDFYEDWNDLPDDSYLINIRLRSKDVLHFEGISKTPETSLTKSFFNKNKEENIIKLCIEEKSINGAYLTKKDKDIIKNNFHKILNHKNFDLHGSFIIPLYDILN